MQMSGDDIKKYPKFKQYVSIAIPKVVEATTIIKAIHKYAGVIEESKIKEALLWGKGPMIKIVVMDDYGQFTPNSLSNEIRIQEKIVKEFESGSKNSLKKTKSGKLVYLVGVTLLHELTHWADDQDGIDTEGEEGEHFENAIYGKVIV
ncbi:MAG TPA: hypothetical protein VK892_18505, partial [Pyrinomonadaceae bacterium]|nr:hypothetical protein [Pyrinomonadaceae bacterium]